ncbi:metal-dependent hydrolase [Methanocella arvoryzae]|uniref:Predicted membrane-bound metal-dependent hydrolase n=1 Tax=Methanocella arvoryzae (strain DSM 22066 / NBRC 105507 / MRE50) TaxID=351160 RepID=Q0W649_METAR|nr:metal-dependent hydrolase [Methanocella arvoryzae]CAJ36144.1 predicted membrane-bound metal-dependent hydrolase [Methanocella arvoryzae MRE50]
MDRTGHFGGSLLLFYGILSVVGGGGDTAQTLALSLVAGAIAAAMSVSPDVDTGLGGIFHRTWITHSLTTVFIATGATYILFDDIFHAGPLSGYVTLAVLSATLSHVLLDSLTRKGVPLFGPFDEKMRGLKWFKSNSLVLNIIFLGAGLAAAAYYYGLIRF